MAGGILNKMTSVFFQEEEEEALKPEEMDQMAKTAEKDVWQEQDPKRARRNQIMAIPGGGAAAPKKACEMVLVRARDYNELPNIAQSIKDQKVVIVNMEELDRMTSQRMVDFLAGAVFALGGETQKVSGSTYLFSSNQVGLEGQIMEQEVQAFVAAEQDYTPSWRR